MAKTSRKRRPSTLNTTTQGTPVNPGANEHNTKTKVSRGVPIGTKGMLTRGENHQNNACKKDTFKHTARSWQPSYLTIQRSTRARKETSFYGDAKPRRNEAHLLILKLSMSLICPLMLC